MSGEPIELAIIDRAALLAMTSDIGAAYVGHNELDVQQIPSVVRSVFSTLEKIGGPQPPAR